MAKNTFKPGTSGNPKGRPKSENAELRKALAARGAEVADVVLTAALNGDLGACRLVLERLCPPLKPTEQPIKLTLPTGEGLSAQGKAIVAAVADGTIAPGQAAQLLTGLGSLARIKEIDELTARIEILEGMERGNA